MSTKNLTWYGVAGVTASLSVVVLAACSSSGNAAGSSTSGSGAGNSAGAAAAANSVGAAAGLKTQSTSIGTVTTDASGHTLYELVGDTTATPKCTGSCLSIWPAVTANGTQVVLQGHPAYTFAGDKAAGQVTGQAVKDQWGTWYALDNTGKPITKAASGSSESSSSGGGGGYGY
jgi:predicted lipoprotein with Yx(FWY)xxD motif